jgi:hypothetical protein
MRKFWTTALVAIFLGTGGCLAPPRLLNPGSEKQQQRRAELFEPYPENDVGPPIVGGRPREYASPRAEVLRVQPRMTEPSLAPCPPLVQ